MQNWTGQDVEYVYRVAVVRGVYQDEEDPNYAIAYVEQVKVRKTAAGAKSYAKLLMKKHSASSVITQAGRIEWWHPKYSVPEIVAAVQAANPDIEPTRAERMVKLAIELYNTPGGLTTEDQQPLRPPQIDA